MKKISPVVFGIALFCFLLPWMNFSCQGQHLANLIGPQLFTDTTIQQPGMFGQRQNQKVDSEPLAVAVLFFTIMGLAFSFLKSRNSSLIQSIVSVVALILLFLLKSKIETDATNQGQGIIQVEYAIGFWLVLIFFTGAIALNGYLYFDSKKQVQTSLTQK